MVLRIKEREKKPSSYQLWTRRSVVNYSRFIGEAMVWMQMPSVIDSPSSRSREKARRWDLTGTEGCGGGKVVSWLSWMFLGYKGIYRRKKYVGGASRGPQGWGARLPPWARPPASWPPRGVSDFDSKSSGLLSVQERSSRRLFCLDSVWYSFSVKL